MILDTAIYDVFVDFLGAIFGGLGLLTIVVGIRYFATSIPFVGLDEDLEENFGFAILALALGTVCFALAIFGTLEIIDEDPNRVHWFSDQRVPNDENSSHRLYYPSCNHSSVIYR
ncbi:MAG: hypothetical protein ACXACI_18860 [Candidatus Hodarchaeales archaeon]|jgi:hypothetical protein